MNERRPIMPTFSYNVTPGVHYEVQLISGHPEFHV